MRIYYRLVNGHHITASAQPSNGELSAPQRELLCEVFAALQEQTNDQCPTPLPPQRIGSYVRVRVGVENDQCFADYANREVN